MRKLKFQNFKRGLERHRRLQIERERERERERENFKLKQITINYANKERHGEIDR